MNILVTGGAGFIGTNVVHHLMTTTTHRVVNLDLLTYAGRRSSTALFEGDSRYTFVHGDIADQKTVDDLLAEYAIEAIVNFAAESHVDRSIHDASAFVRTNIAGTQVLIDAARARKVKRLLHISTDEVYGDLSETEPAFTEENPLKPSSPYAASKASADMLILAAFRTHRQPVLITRCSNNYGPFQFPEKFIPLCILKARKEEPIPVYGKGTNVRDWIHVLDHAKGILAVLEKGREGEVYNLGGASEWRNIDVVGEILTLLGRSRDLIRFVTDRPGHDRRYAIDFAKAAKELGWSPRMNFVEGLKQTIAWYNDHPDFLTGSETEAYASFCQKHYGDFSHTTKA